MVILTAVIPLMSLAIPVMAATTATLCLVDSRGAGIEGAQAEFRSGSWHLMGQTEADGCVSTESPLAVGNRSFRVTHNGQTQQKTHNTTIDPQVTFQTIQVTGQLLDSTDTGIPGAVIQYNAGGWKTLGTTDSNGQAGAELLPATLNFRVTHNGQTQQKTHNTNIDPQVTFQTGQVLQGTGPRVLRYYASGWKTFTSGIELLPGVVRFDLDSGPDQQHTVVAGSHVYVPTAPTPPVVDAGVSLNVDEGGEILLVAGFVDVEASQAHSASVDWGDGSASQIGTVTQSDGLSGIVTANHVYVDDGVYTIEVCVTDNGNPDATGCSTVTATVANLAPTASITIIEDATFPGNQISLQAIATDPGTSDTLGYTWTVTHKAKVVATGTNPVIDFTPSEPGEYRVDLTVEDGDGKSTQANTTLTVPPAPPTTSAPPLPDPGSDPEPVPDPAPRPDPEPKTPHLTKSGMDAAKPSTGTEGSPPIGHPDAAGPSKTITGPATQAAETSVPESPGDLPVEPTEEAAPISNQASDTDWAPALGWILAISAPLLLGLAFRRIRAGG